MRNSTSPDENRLQTEDLLTDSTARESAVEEHGSADRRTHETGHGEHTRTGNPAATFKSTEDSTGTAPAPSANRADGHAGAERTLAGLGSGDRTAAFERPTADRTTGDHTGSDRSTADSTTAGGTTVGSAAADHTKTAGEHGRTGTHDAGQRAGGHTEATPTDEIPAQRELRERGTPAATEAEEPGAELFSGAEVERFRGEWSKVQANFVDDPREAVRDADHLVAEVMQNLAKTFAEHKRGLEGQWQGGDSDNDAHTEDLRQALRRYRSFFNQLLHT